MQSDDVLSHESIPIVHSLISKQQGKEAPKEYTLSMALSMGHLTYLPEPEESSFWRI